MRAGQRRFAITDSMPPREPELPSRQVEVEDYGGAVRRVSGSRASGFLPWRTWHSIMGWPGGPRSAGYF